ncbi:MAG: hypothetical protein ACP5LD_10585 [Desulfomonilaceae bacterium]
MAVCSQPGQARIVDVPPYIPTPPVPDVVVGTVTNPNSVGAVVTWSPVAGATSYKVYVNGSVVWTGTSTTAQITLVPGQSYQIALAVCVG